MFPTLDITRSNRDWKFAFIQNCISFFLLRLGRGNINYFYLILHKDLSAGNCLNQRMGRKRCGYLTYVKEGIEYKLQKGIRHFTLHPDLIRFCERLVIFVSNQCIWIFVSLYGRTLYMKDVLQAKDVKKLSLI
jgi:hypothetical protein